MAIERLTVSLPAEFSATVHEAATLDDQSVSPSLAKAAKHRSTAIGLGPVVSDWEAAHGKFSDEELAAAHDRLEH